MKVIEKRLAALEGKAAENSPPVVLAWGNAPPIFPAGLNENSVMVIRRIVWQPPVRDAQDNIIEPARPWDDDDPRYFELAARECAGRSQLNLAAVGARDTLVLKLQAMDMGNDGGALEVPASQTGT